MSLRVLVTDGDERASLAVVRSLGRAGCRVHVCGPGRRTVAAASRYAEDAARVASPSSDPHRFVEDVRRLISSRGIDLLLPMTEPSLLLLLARRAELPPVTIPFPDIETFRRICDKKWVLERAGELGIAVPRQTVLAEARAQEEAMGDIPGFPLVLKPARSVTRSSRGLERRGVVHLDDRAALDRYLGSLPPEAYPVLLQERVEGPGVGVFLLLWDGELRAVSGHRRLREKPPSGGVSVLRESVSPDPELVRLSVALLRSCAWNGVAMVEFKLDGATGTPYLMEINGRFWGSLQLAIDAGVDFPRLLVEAASGVPATPPPEYREGVRTRWLWGDVDHLLARLREPSRWSSFLPPGAGRMDALRGFVCAFGPGSREELLRPDDPGPFLRETADRLRSAQGAFCRALNGERGATAHRWRKKA